MYYVGFSHPFIINNFMYSVLIIKVVTKAYIIHKVIDYKGRDKSLHNT
jgi:hypothetical protein